MNEPVSAATLPQPSAEHAIGRLQRQLWCIGWSLESVDVDLTRDVPRLEIRAARTDGRWILARCDHLGRGFVERFQRSRALAMPCGTTGRRPLAPQVLDHFLGRERTTGPQETLYAVANYLVGNPVVSPPDGDGAAVAQLSAPDSHALRLTVAEILLGQTRIQWLPTPAEQPAGTAAEHAEPAARSHHERP